MTEHRFPEPRQCIYWEKPELVRGSSMNDPQCAKYIPVSTAEETACLARFNSHDLLLVSPAHCIDFPKEAKVPTSIGAVSTRPAVEPPPSPVGIVFLRERMPPRSGMALWNSELGILGLTLERAAWTRLPDPFSFWALAVAQN